MDISAQNLESYPQSVNAIVLPNLGEAYNSVDYIKGVSAVIGIDHINSIYETVDSVQIVLKNEEYVNTLIENGIRVKGRFVSVDYAVPPGTQIILIDDDCSISNDEIIQELSKYCWIKSPIIHITEFNEEELSHIRNGKRKVYVEFVRGCEIPSELKLLHNGTYHQIRVIISENSQTNSQTSSNNLMIHNDDSSRIVFIKHEILEIETNEGTTVDEYLSFTYSKDSSEAQTSVGQIQDYASCAAVPKDDEYKSRRIAERPQRTSKNCEILRQSASNPIFSDKGSFGDKVLEKRPQRTSKNCEILRQSASNPIFSDKGSFGDKVLAKRPQRTSKNCEILRQSASNPIFSGKGSFGDKVHNFLENVRFRRNVKELADIAVAKGEFNSLSHLLDELATYTMQCDLATSMRINQIMQKLLDAEEESALKNR